MEPSTILLLITICTVIVVDLSGFIDHIKMWIWKWVWKNKKEYRDFELKPIDCSFCMNFWLSLGYLLIWGKWTLGLMTLSLFLSLMTPIIKDILMLVKAFCSKIIDVIYMWYIDN